MQLFRTAFVSAVLCAALTTQGHAVVEWSLATGLPDDNFFSKNYMQLIQDVETASKGELKIKYYGNNTLVKRDAIRRAIQTGQIQMGEVDFINLSNENPVFLLDSLPAFAPGYDDAWKLMEAQKPYAEKLFGERGLRIIAYAPWPGQGFYSKKPIKSLADTQGIKLRIYSKPTEKMAQTLGFSPVILPAAEVPQAFATGLIDAMFTSAATGVITQAWDNTKHFLFVGAMHSKQSLVVNDGAFKALSPALQKILLDAGAAATKRGWKMSEEQDEKDRKALARNGMTVTQSWPELDQKMAGIGAELIADWKKNAPPEALAVVTNFEKMMKK